MRIIKRCYKKREGRRNNFEDNFRKRGRKINKDK